MRILRLSSVIALITAWASVAVSEVLFDQRARSPALEGEIRYSVYLPEGAQTGERFPTLFLLHGLGAGQREWLEGGRIEETLDRLISSGDIHPLIVVMPDAGKSWYVNSARFGGPGDYETAITRDLVAEIDAKYPTLAGPEHRAIAGVSMGGHGALRLAYMYPGVFSAVAALSPGIWLPGGVSEATGPASETAEQREKWYPKVAGETFDLDIFNQQSPFSYIANLAEIDQPPAIFLAVGDDDFWKLHDGTVEMYIELRRAGISPELRVGDGGHNWEYWRTVSEAALKFLSSHIQGQ